jgi:hypothetical protein
MPGTLMVLMCVTHTRRFRHPAVGTLGLVFHSFYLAAADQGKHVMTVYTAEPGTPHEDGLKLLATWAATHATAAADPAPSAADNT